MYHWGIEPEIAVGLAPRTQVELAAPIAYLDAGSGRSRGGLAGLELSALHTLNAETSIPAIALAADVLLPVGGLGPEITYASLKGIVTKTLRWARFHVNAQYTLGSEPDERAAEDEAPGAVEVSRWMAGVAVDRALPLRSLLLTAEAHARRPIVSEGDIEWTTGAGVRYQLDPRWAMDAGAGRRLTGEDPAWYATFGAAYAFGLPWRR
jgi:hypothetical protein